jgi:S1-C subfamily serine protease
VKKCPNCGYVRRPEDDELAMVPSKACPKCYAFYPSEQTAPKAPDPPVVPAIDGRAAGALASPPKKQMSRAGWIALLIAAVAVSFAAAFYLAGMMKDSSSTTALQDAGKAQPVERAEEAPQQTYTVSELVKKISPSVVSVINYNERGEIVGMGTGFFAGGAGEVVTNRHVLKGSSFEIKTAGGRTYAISGIVSEDEFNDLVVLATRTPSSEAAPLRISNFQPERGERVVVIGSPFGLEQSVSDGIVSAYRDLNNRKVLQITAPISPGSSGSPVVNTKGEVIGVASMQYIRGQNINFCIPGQTILGLRPSTGRPLGDITPYKPSVKLYFYQDEDKTVHFVKNPDKPRSNYILLTKPDGTLDRDKFESWLFEQLGGNPYKIDPQALANAEKERFPELFRQVFPGHEIEDLKKFSPEARAYWGTWVANHMQAVYNRAANERNAGIRKHQEMMAFLDRMHKGPGNR